MAPQLFRILGDLDADVTLTSGIWDKNNSTPEVQVGGKFKAGRTFKMNGYDHAGTIVQITDPAGLEGQIILNAGNNHPTNANWRGTVKVGSNTLSPKNKYTQIGLGGGAVGFAPFHLYDEDCSPQNNISTPNMILQSQFTPAAGLKLHFYGPVEANTSVAYPLRVIHYVDGVSFDVTHRCDFAFNGREIKISAKSGTFFMPTDDSSLTTYYTVENYVVGTASSPICQNVTGNPDVPDFTYYFDLGSDCDGDGFQDLVSNNCGRPGGCDTDINNDGFITGDDFDIFVLLFEAGDPLADFNGDSFVNGNDYDKFVDKFELGC